MGEENKKKKLNPKEKLLYYLIRHWDQSHVQEIIDNQDDNELFIWLLEIIKELDNFQEFTLDKLREIENFGIYGHK